MTKEEIKIIKDCMKAIDKYREKKWKTEDERTAATLEMNKVLKGNGFSGAAAFSEWYEKVIFPLYKKCNPIEGSCDGCVGIPIPKCVEVYKGSACFLTRPSVSSDTVYRIAFKGRIENHHKTKNGKTTLICPEGHGFFLDESKRIKPPDGIDFYWKV